MSVNNAEVIDKPRIAMLKVLNPFHIWALGVGIVLVGEFMGWNFSVAKGGAYGSLIACWVIGLLYTCVAMIDSEVTSTVAAAGGQYTQAKHIIGPLMAFNVGLYLVMAYTMLCAADALVVGDLMKAGAEVLGHPGLDPKPFVVLTIAFLAWLNYRGVFATLTLNFVITLIAFTSILVLFLAVDPMNPGKVLQHEALLTNLPYGWIGVVAALQFGMWYYLGIEGTCQAAEEVRSAGRSIPLGTMGGMITLLVAASLTWFICTALMPWQYLGQAVTPLYDAASILGNTKLQLLLFVATMFAAIASANGCINDASRAWFSLGRDRYMPAFFGAIHPRYRTPYRSIIFLVPIAVSFAFTGLLDQVITFAILSGLLGYTFMSFNIFKFRKMWPLGSIHRGYIHPFHPIPAITLLILCSATYFATFLGYGSALLSIMAFYIIASIWFTLRRYKFVKRADQFTMPWPRPKGY
ncbi:APC family permease [Glaciimonas sp. PCH181]|uniref:APC family permease n=1 Tax=Glaciimonas sp. PCH181 TaxID=2133943 RepID=UPI001CED60F1|nr:amino acid permease [Glaciimonas sp. PCH181]